MEYLLKFSAVLGLFYVFYKLFLEKETFFNSIRGYFIIGILTALFLPFIVIPEYIYVDDLFAGQTFNSSATDGAALPEATIDPMLVLFIVYGLGVLFFGLRFLIQLASLTRFIFGLPKKKMGRFIFISTDEEISPFSFFNYIIYPNRGFNEEELQQIIDHEKVHASQLHTADILLSQLLIIFNWFNPIAWFYHKEVQKNLEFIADEGTQKVHDQKEAYQYLLLKTVSPNYPMALTSNFYNSIIKKRINMLQKNKSGKMMYAKFIFIIPILVAFALTFNTKVIAQQKKVEKIEITKQMEIEVISKDFQKTDLDALKANLLKKGINLNYKKLKYNSSNEIISIALSVSNTKGNKTQIEQVGSTPIKPISIKFDSDGALAIGNMESMEDHLEFVSEDGKKIHKKVIVTSSGDKSSSDVNSYVFVSDDGTETHIKTINGETVTEEIHGPHGKNIWISKAGDTTKLKNIEVIEINEKNDGKKQVFVKKIQKGDDDVEVIVKVSGDENDEDHKMVFISEDGEQPLMIVDGKEMEGGSLEDIDPEKIESVNVLKGDKAVEEYGDKGKNGVVIISTKK